MRSAVVLVCFSFAACQLKSPEEAAGLYNVQVSDGFRSTGGVAVSKNVVITNLELITNAGSAQILTGSGQGMGGKVAKRDKAIDTGIITVEGGSLDHATPGCSGDVQPGTTLVTAEIDAKGEKKVIQATFTGWRYNEGRAVMETNSEATDAAKGAGYFAPDGTLVGIQVFKMGQKMTYLLPIEYAVAGPKALTARQLGEMKDCESFARIRAEAKKHPDPLPEPVTPDKISNILTISRTAFVGQLTLLDKKEGGAREQPVKFTIDILDAAKNKKTLVEATLDKSNVKWAENADGYKDMNETMGQAFGPDWIKANLEPYVFGDLRFRVPFSVACAKLTDNNAQHVLVLHLGDGRKSPEMGFDTAKDLCAGGPEGEGDAIEKEWGFSAAHDGPAAGGGEKKGGKKKKKKH
jgi:hypothetical protein